MNALEIRLEGRVQGVGFRPFVRNLARRHGIAGWVGNTMEGVVIHAEAPSSALETFRTALEVDAPPHVGIRSRRETSTAVLGLDGFSIRESDETGEARGTIVPDLCLCDECRRELFDPSNRRHLHPFISCACCGPSG